MRLIDLQKEAVGRGSVLRMPGLDPDEDISDLMLVEMPGGRMSLVVSTGYKAGIVMAALPPESYHPGTRMVSVQWLRENWGKRVTSDVKLEDVEILGNYPVPSTLSL